MVYNDRLYDFRDSFADWVINQISNHGMQYSDGFLGPDYFVNHDREFSSEYWADAARADSDWNLFPGFSPSLYRGKEQHQIRLTRDQKTTLKKFIKLFNKRNKIENKLKAIEKEERALKAQCTGFSNNSISVMEDV